MMVRYGRLLALALVIAFWACVGWAAWDHLGWIIPCVLLVVAAFAITSEQWLARKYEDQCRSPEHNWYDKHFSEERD